MPTRRDASPEERSQLEAILDAHRSKRALFEAFGQGVVIAGIVPFACFAAALAVVFVVERVSDLEVSVEGNEPGILIVGVMLGIAYAIRVMVPWYKRAAMPDPELQHDLQCGKVLEEELQVVAIKRFIEPEHGGRLCFLKMKDDRVLTLFDPADVEGNDELALKPLSFVSISYSPKSKILLSMSTHGDPITTQDFELSADPDEWPMQDTWSSIPWAKLETRLSS